MDTKIKALILLLFSAFTTFAQTPGINFAAKFNITSATGGDPYNITGIVLDDLSRFTGSDVQVNDSIYVIDGDQLYVLAVTSITSVVGPTVTLVANDPNNAGVSIPTGQAAICRPTDNYKLPLYISGLRDDLRSMVMNRQAQLIDDINGSAVSAITDFTSAGVNVPPSPAASLNGGETWRNMTTGELWGSDGNVWYPYTRGPKECQDTVLVSAITVQSGGSVTTGSPLIRNSSGVWEHMYNHPSGTNLIPDGVVTDVISGPRAIIQYCGVRKGSGATPNTSYYVNQSISTGFTTTKPITDIRPLGKVASNGDFLVNAGLLFSRDNVSNNKIIISGSAPTDTSVTWANTARVNKGAYPMYRYKSGWIQTGDYYDKLSDQISVGLPINILISGQSNIVGPFPGTRSVDAPGYIGDTLNHPKLVAVDYNGVWKKAVSGVWPPIFVTNMDGATHSMVAGKRIIDRTGKTVRLIISGTGGQAIEFWRPGNTGWQELDSTLQRAYRTGMGKVDAFLWFHGEAGSLANTYQEQWDSLIGRLRTRQYWDSTYTMIMAPSDALAVSTIFPGATVAENVLRRLDYDNDAATKYIRPLERKEVNTLTDIFHYTPREHEKIGKCYADQILGWTYRDNSAGRSITSTTNSITLIYPRQDSIINLYNLRTNNVGAYQNKFSFGGSTNYTLVENIKPTGSSSGYQIDYHFNGSSTPSATINSNGFRTTKILDLPTAWDETTSDPTGGIVFANPGGVGNDIIITKGAGGDLVYNSGNVNHSFRFQNVETMKVSQNKVGIGITPTARLHLAAGTPTAQTAPLKFVAGTNMTTQEAGAMEWDGTSLFITQTTGPTRKTIAYTTDIKVMREESFTATAAQTAFTIAYSAPAVSGTSVPIRVYRNGVRLFYVASGPTITQFTYSGTTVTTAANTVGDIITIEYLN